MASVSVIEAGRPVPRRPSLLRTWRGSLQGSEYAWALAFCIPYVAVFAAFVAYPIVYGLWLGHKPSLYVELWQDPIFQMTIVNTILYLVIGVNVKMFGALLLSGFFMRRGWWVKGLLMIYVLPWAVPALPTFISIHWMLNGQWGLFNNVLYDVFGIDGPGWLDTSRWLALGAVIVSYIWKNMPFWTVICSPAGCRSRKNFTRRPKSTALLGCVGSPMCRSHCSPISISCALCSQRFSPSATSIPRLSSPAAGRR